MSNRPPWPLEPIYQSLTKRDWYRKNIQKLLDLNFGKIWTYYVKVRYVNKHMQHRVNICEVRDEEKIDLTPYKIKGINITRRAYYGHSVALLKFFYESGSDVEVTKKQIESGAFRFKEKDGSYRIKDTLDNGSPTPEHEIEKQTDAQNSDINLEEVATFKSKSDFEEKIDEAIKKAAKTVKINTGL